MRMLGWILGLTLRNKKRNDDIRRILRLACITDKVREARLRWFGHVQYREEKDCVRKILEADVHGQRSTGRQRKKVDRHRKVQHGGLAGRPDGHGE